jgi:hypothetical protein
MWAGITAVATVALAVVAFLQYGNAATNNAPTQVVAYVTVTPAPAGPGTSEAPLPTQTTAHVAANNSAAPLVAPLALAKLGDDSFIKHPYNPQKGANSIAGVDYPQSYSWAFINCSSCTESVEFNVPAGYTSLSGTVGLADDSRHDSVIDGVVYVAIYSATGATLLEPTRLEYPATIPVAIDLNGNFRIRIEVSEGTNYEDVCLCNFMFSP